MKPTTFCCWTLALTFVFCCCCCEFVSAASPTVEQALQLKPIQPNVDFAKPTAAEVAQCKIRAKKAAGQSGWVIEDPQGLVLREFVDTNGDNTVDRWSYYKDGVEVYRDMDADFDGKHDQYRWLHHGGTRWGLDKNQDRKIDAWKSISAEEVTAEVVAALAAKDTARFQRLVLTSAELQSLGLGKEKTAAIAEKVRSVADGFRTLAQKQVAITSASKWVQFSGTRPGIVPAGSDGSTRDLRVYENTVAIAQTGSQHIEVQIGTLVQVGDVWRLIDAPQIVPEGEGIASSGFFFRPAGASQAQTATAGSDQQTQKLLAELEQLDQKASKATTAGQQTAFNVQRTALLWKLAEQAATAQQREMWVRQAADMISAAVQSGTFPDGIRHLETLLKSLQADQADRDLVPYVVFRKYTAEYGLALRAEKPDYEKIQTHWLKNLAQFVTDYPTAPDSAEALLQLAIAQEYAGEEKKAIELYGRVVKAFADSPTAKKAAGAQVRLSSVGKVLTFSGRSTKGGVVDLAKYRGKIVLIQYWTTWSNDTLRDMAALKEIAAKHSRFFSVIGVNLDDSPKALSDYLAKNKLPWPQIYEQGGMDSRPANALGIFTVPTMILVDQRGQVISRNLQTTELDSQLRKLIR